MKVCFVGIGSIAKRHINNLREICVEQGIDIQIDALRRKCSDMSVTPEGVDNVYHLPEEMPDDYDVIFITNPTEFHADTLIRLHDSSRHFFIEKPVTSFETLERLKKISYRNDSVYYVACPMRYMGIIQFLKRELDTEKVNSVRSLSSSYLPDWRPGVDYRNTYSAHKDLGGGVGIDLIHEWDYLTYLFGMPTEVDCYSGKVSALEIDSDDYAIYIAKYGKQMVSELHLDYFGIESRRNVEICTEEDTIIGDFITGKLSFLKSGKEVDLSEERNAYQKRELLFFLSVISGHNENPNDIIDAIKVLKLTRGII